MRLRNQTLLAVVLATALALLVLALMARGDGEGKTERPPRVAGWTRLNVGASDFTRVLTVPGHPKAVYATTGYSGIHVTFGSADGGATWRPLGDRELLAVDPVRPRTLYAWSEGEVTGRIEKSTDAGATWRPASRGLRAYVTSIVVDPKQTRRLYASSPTGIFKSTNGGASWFRVGPGPGGDRGQALAIDPVRPSTLYAGRSHFQSRPGLFKSVDGGRLWRQLRAPWSLDEIAIDPRRAQTLYSWYPWEVGSPAKSTNGGETWIKLKVRPAGFQASEADLTYDQLAIDPSRADTVYLTVSDYTNESFVLKSTTGGESWAVVARLQSTVEDDSVLPDEAIPVHFTGLAVDPTGRRVYAGTDFGGLYLCERCWKVTSPVRRRR